MKTSSIVNCRLGLALVIAMTVSSTGCRSSTWKMPSWRMPGSKFFASREPDAETLAGKGNVPTLPESPASKYTSSNIAALGKSPTTSGSNSALAGTTNSSSPYGYSNPTSTPQAGLAAQGNGFQTGPYQMGNQAGLTTGTNPKAGTLASGPTGLPATYGGSYTGASNDSKMATNSVSNAMSMAQGSTSLPNAASLSYNAPASSTGPALPNSAELLSPPSAFTNNNFQNLPSPSTAIGSIDPTRATGGTYTLANPAAHTTPTGGTQTPAASAYQSASTTGFAPGSTGRSTTHDFSGTRNATQTGSNTLQPPTTALPPNTATLPTNLPVNY